MKKQLSILAFAASSLIASGASAQAISFVSEVRLFATNYCPTGWVVANGQTLAIKQNPVIFNLIGTTYGGDGKTTFKLPNLQGRAPTGVDSAQPLGTQAGPTTVTINKTANAGGTGVTTQTPTLSMTWCIALVGIYPSQN